MFGPAYEVLPALVLTGAKEMFDFVQIGDRDALFDLDLDYDEVMNFAGMVLMTYEQETGEDATGLDAETRDMMEKAMNVIREHPELKEQMKDVILNAPR